MQVTILGAGSFGTSLSLLFLENNHETYLWSNSKDTVDNINNLHENLVYLPGIKLPSELKATSDFKKILNNADLVLSALPTQATREVWSEAAQYLQEKALILVASKGIEKKTHKFMHQILPETFGFKIDERVYYLSGPSFARELAFKMPTTVTIAGKDIKVVSKLQKIIQTPYFRAYGSQDVIGVELAGALKNIIAIAAGISDGLGLGHNARAALITRGLAEISRLGAKMGAQSSTFMGLAGLGDLVLTCNGELSRNRKVGIAIGKGENLINITNNMRITAEGVPTTQVAWELAQKYKVDMPIISGVYKILYENASPNEILIDLMKRTLKFEEE